ncbi:hypothetical protein CI102_13623 [Trichoderma harzianum]|nr:hypothetical protein CI102_13623 [Trichoderma harzianum]
MSATNFAPVYLDNTEFFMNSSNIVNLSWPKVSEAFVKPLTSHIISFPGYDWTEPYPGKSFVEEGHTMGLMISDDFFMNETAGNKLTTVLTGLTFNIPKGMKSNGKALPMHPSWYICRHIFISTNAAMKKSGDKNTCDALPSDCKNDLAAALTNDWGYKNEDFMCSQRIADSIPQSCVGTFGFSRQDILTINSTTLAGRPKNPEKSGSKDRAAQPTETTSANTSRIKNDKPESTKNPTRAGAPATTGKAGQGSPGVTWAQVASRGDTYNKKTQKGLTALKNPAPNGEGPARAANKPRSETNKLKEKPDDRIFIRVPPDHA